MMDIFEQTSGFLSSCLMLAVWSVVFFTAIYIERVNRLKLFRLAAGASLMMMLYYVWAISDVWDTHFAATTFNRSFQIAAAIFWFLFLVGMYRGNR